MSLKGIRKSDGTVEYIYADDTLSEENAPGEAKATGDRIGGVEGRVTTLETAAPEIISNATKDWLDDNVTPTGSAVAIDSSLTQSGLAADAKAAGDAVNDLKSDLNYSHTAEPGYVLRATNTGHGNEWAMVGTPTDAQAEEAINAWLDAHPEATTTVQDGAITEVKLADSLRLKAVNEYVTPEMFGAKGDGVTDDTLAITAAIDSDLPVLMCKNYVFSSPIVINKRKTIKSTGILTYTGTDSAIILQHSLCQIELNEVVSNGNGIEFRPVNINSLTHCQMNIVTANRVLCNADNGSIALYMNCTSGIAQFNKIIINRLQGGTSISTNIGLKIKTASNSNKYCNANIFDLHSICFFDTAILGDAVENSCMSNYFNNINFEQNNTALDVVNSRFFMTACFDEPTSGVFKINDEMVCRLMLNGFMTEDKLSFDASKNYTSDISIEGSIITSGGVFLTDNLRITRRGWFSRNCTTPLSSTILSHVIGTTIVKYITNGDTISLPAVRKGGVLNGSPSRIDLFYATTSGQSGTITLSFADGTTTEVTYSKNEGLISITPNAQNTGQWTFVS